MVTVGRGVCRCDAEAVGMVTIGSWRLPLRCGGSGDGDGWVVAFVAKRCPSLTHHSQPFLPFTPPCSLAAAGAGVEDYLTLIAQEELTAAQGVELAEVEAREFGRLAPRFHKIVENIFTRALLDVVASHTQVCPVIAVGY